jgi:hypothetical protein
MDRTLIVRPAALNDNKSGKSLVKLGDKEKGPTMDCCLDYRRDRWKDVCRWSLDQPYKRQIDE